MDFHALQHKLFEIEPSNPIEDKQKMIAAAQGNLQKNAEPKKDYVQESLEVPQGSMPLGIDDISDFAKLAGVTINETQKMGSAGQAKGKDPMPNAKPGRTKHPLKDKLVGEDQMQIGTEMLDIAETADFFSRAFYQAWKANDRKSQKELLDNLQKSLDRAYNIFQMGDDKSVDTIERSLTKGEEKSKEKYVKGMKKNKGDFEKRYGKDAKAVMYATATKMAKNESIKDMLYKALNDYKS